MFSRNFFEIFPKLVHRALWRHYHPSHPQKEARNPMQSYYEMPDKYRNSFFLANASFFDNSNWFIHNAYEIAFESLVTELKLREPTFNDEKAFQTVRSLIYSIENCDELMDIRISSKNENSCVQTYRAYRAHHGVNVLNRPCLGGLRLQTTYKKDHCKALALLATYRNCCAGVNLAGAHGGIKIEPSEINNKDLQTVLKQYASELTKHNFCGSTIDVLEPDLNCGSKQIDFFSSVKSKENLDDVICVGKLGDISNYYSTVVSGMILIMEHFINNEKLTKRLDISKGIKHKTFIIQGLGNTGAIIAEFLEKNGAICVGVKEKDAYLYCKNGIPVQAIVSHKNNTGSILNFSESVKPYKVYDLFKEECDILILAAKHKSLQCYLADKINAKIVMEVANGGISPCAYKILVGRNKLVIPDIVLNAPYSITSYFEYLRDMEGISFGEIVKKYSSKFVQDVLSSNDNEEQVIFNSMKCILNNMLKEVQHYSGRYKLDMDFKTGAYINSINKIFTLLYNSKQY